MLTKKLVVDDVPTRTVLEYTTILVGVKIMYTLKKDLKCDFLKKGVRNVKDVVITFIKSCKFITKTGTAHTMHYLT